ncbi:MAG: patatin-like phospholipase family protein [Anaerolineales bacterium]|nr:patatin-like phospholipase family protein [Anaerolineales bacterium]MCB8951248.1 patatin-like phospholipase family protein [Ardenticatenales bacterium]
MSLPTIKRNGHPRVGLALSGGVARIIAHVGVLSVLMREPGLHIDAVAGTSAGSIVGAAYCAGLGLCDIEKMSGHADWRTVAAPTLSRHGLLSFSRLEHRMMCVLGDLWFCDLRTPLAVMATDLETSEPVVLHEGRVAQAVRASCSVPGFVVPTEKDGRQLVDGGIADNLPAEILREMGADYVIGVDIFAPHWDRRLGPLGAGLMGIETLIRRAGGGLNHVDCLIAPRLSGISFLRFNQVERLLALGQEAAQACLPQIRADLGL